MRTTALESWICEREGLTSLSREKIEALQLERLNALLAREKARGGFYKGLPERLGSLSELTRLPFTTAEQLSKNAGGLLLRSQSEAARVITDATSGTSGAAKRVFYTQGDCENTVGFFAAGLSELAFPGERVMVCMPFSGPRGLGELIAEALERLGAEPLRVGVGLSFAQLGEIARRESPAAFVGMPAPLLGLLRLGHGGALRRALISGDACPESVAAGIEGILGSRLFPHYGSREMGLGGAVTCRAHEGMHLRENHVIAEIIGEDGEPLPDGETGELVVTTIGMEAMPLIRYRTGDLGRILPGDCPCGGVTRRLEGVRRKSAGPDMSDADGALFALPELIDWRGSLEGGALKAELVTLSPCSARALSALSALFPAAEVELSERRPRPGDGPAYPGKRALSPAPDKQGA